MSEANVQVVRRFQAAAVAGSTDDLVAVVADEVVVHEAASLPYGGDHHGLDGLRHVFGSFRSTWRFTAAAEFRLIDGGGDDVVVVVGESDVTARATGRTARFGIVELHRVTDGKIREITVCYSDTAAMLAALEPG